MRFTIFSGLLPATLLLVACGGDAPAPKPPAVGNGLGVPEAKLKFLTIEEIRPQPDAAGVPLPARIEIRPQAVFRLDAPVPGQVTAIHVRPGEAVRAGAALATIRSADAAGTRATLEQARSRAATADAMLQRHEEMVSRGVGTDVERQEARARAEEARAELERARQTSALLGTGQGDIVVLRTPASGVVADINASVGSIVDPGGEPLISLADASQLWAVAEAAEADADIYRKGQGATVRIASLDRTLRGTIDGFGSRVDAETRRRPIFVALHGDLRGLTPGQYAELRIEGNGTQVLTLPASAVLIKDGKRRVAYVQRPDGKFEPRELRVGATRNGAVPVLEGLMPGDRVVVRNALLLDGEAEQQL